MKKNNYLMFLLMSLIIFPSFVFASWWNPFTWFNRKPINNSTAIVTSTSIEKEDKPAKKSSSEYNQPTNKNKQSVVKSCRPEIIISEKVPTLQSGNPRSFFSRVIVSNPPLNNLESIRSTLIRYREDVIVNSGKVPSSVLLDENGNRIAYAPWQLDDLEKSYYELDNQLINGYYDYIKLTDKLINDKKLDNCLDGKDLYDYL